MKFHKHSRIYHTIDYLTHPIMSIDQLIRNINDYTAVSYDKFIFIVGAPRSGTTLLYKTIKNNTKVSGFDAETEVFSSKRLSNFKRFECFMERYDFDNCLKSTNSNIDFFKEIHLNLGGDTFIEKTPQHILKMNKLIKSFPNSYFIHIKRDPRDAFISGNTSNNIPQAKNSVKYFSYWNSCIFSCEKQKEINSQFKLYELKYEDFVCKPDFFIDEIIKFCDLKKTKSLIKDDPRGNLDKFRKLNKPIDNKSVGRWKESVDFLLIQKNLLPYKKTLEKIGYEY